MKMADLISSRGALKNTARKLKTTPKQRGSNSVSSLVNLLVQKGEGRKGFVETGVAKSGDSRGTC